MSPPLRSALKLSPVQAAAKRIKKSLNITKKVKFNKIVHKKNITPLSVKVVAIGYFKGGDPASSFSEVTDQSVQSIETPPKKAKSPSPVIVQEEKRQRRRSNLYRNMSGSVKTFFSPKLGKRSVPPVPAKEEDDDIVIVEEVINTKKKAPAVPSSKARSNLTSVSSSKGRRSAGIPPPSTAKSLATDRDDISCPSVSSHSTRNGTDVSRTNDTIVSRQPPQLWIDAFMPTKEEDVIHGPSLYKLKDWLKRWKKRLTILAKTENEPPKKKTRRNDDDDSDYDVENETDELHNPFVLSGPTGCGKTSIVHFLAKNHGFNIIELSSSEERSSLTMGKKLQGATENFGVLGPGDIRAAMFGQKSKQSSFKYNLILIDDADVVFKSDSGFWTKIAQYSVESRVPFVLTCTNEGSVTCHLENSEFESDNFMKRENNVIIRHLNEWITEHYGIMFDKHILKTIVKQSNQDVRKALNNLQFNGNQLSINEETEFTKKFSSLSSRSLAEMDCILTKCNEFEKKSKVRWNAKDFSNIDYVPVKSSLQIFEIPAVDNNNEQFINDLSNLMSSCLPEDFQRLEKMDHRLSTNLLSCRKFSAPILPAVYDAYKRSNVRSSSPRIVALYELPILAAINRGFNDRMKDQPSRRRILHPFKVVDTVLEKQLDVNGLLTQSIGEYYFDS